MSASDSLGEHLVRVGELGLGRPVLPVRVDDRLELGVPPPGLARGRLIAGGVDLRESRLELLELGLQVGQVFEHRRSAYRGRSRGPSAFRARLPEGGAGHANRGIGAWPAPTTGSGSTPSQPCSTVAK